MGFPAAITGSLQCGGRHAIRSVSSEITTVVRHDPRCYSEADDFTGQTAQVQSSSVLLNLLPASGPCLARWSNAPCRYARSGKARRLHFPPVNQSAAEDALRPGLQHLLIFVRRPLSFEVVLDIPSVCSDCSVLPLLSLLEAPKQSIDLHRRSRRRC